MTKVKKPSTLYSVFDLEGRVANTLIQLGDLPEFKLRQLCWFHDLKLWENKFRVILLGHMLPSTHWVQDHVWIGCGVSRRHFRMSDGVEFVSFYHRGFAKNVRNHEGKCFGSLRALTVISSEIAALDHNSMPISSTFVIGLNGQSQSFLLRPLKDHPDHTYLQVL